MDIILREIDTERSSEGLHLSSGAWQDQFYGMDEFYTDAQ